jgi:hypothetical protein
LRRYTRTTNDVPQGIHSDISRPRWKAMLMPAVDIDMHDSICNTTRLQHRRLVTAIIHKGTVRCQVEVDNFYSTLTLFPVFLYCFLQRASDHPRQPYPLVLIDAVQTEVYSTFWLGSSVPSPTRGENGALNHISG